MGIAQTNSGSASKPIRIELHCEAPERTRDECLVTGSQLPSSSRTQIGAGQMFIFRGTGRGERRMRKGGKGQWGHGRQPVSRCWQGQVGPMFSGSPSPNLPKLGRYLQRGPLKHCCHPGHPGEPCPYWRGQPLSGGIVSQPGSRTQGWLAPHTHPVTHQSQNRDLNFAHLHFGVSFVLL